MRNIAIIRTPVILLIAGILALAAGCGPQPVATKVGTPLEREEKVIAKAYALRKNLRVTNHVAERTTGDLLKVRLGLENLDDDDLWVDFQVVFYDKAGFELEKTNWQPVFMANRQVTYFETTSLSSQPVDYTVFLREPRESE
jgi:uncharacterized protein YcfL